MDSIGYFRPEVNQVVKNGLAMPRADAILLLPGTTGQANPKIQSLTPFALTPFAAFVFIFVMIRGVFWLCVYIAPNLR